MKKTRVVISLLLALMLMLGITGMVSAEGEPVIQSASQGQNGTTLSATVTLIPEWTRTFHWTIGKSVTPSVLDMFRGDSGSVEYTVAVVKDGGTDEASLSGKVCVTNGGAVATESLAITVDITLPGPKDDVVVIASTTVDVSSALVIAAGGTKCYDYSVPITSPAAGTTYKATAHVTITNHSGHLGEPFGPDPSASGPFLSSPVLVNDSINVDDTNGESWSFSDSGSESYSKTFTCDTGEGQHDNTATIRETGLSDSASVQVNCYVLGVTKEASTSFTRTYNWHINKSVDQPSLTLALNQSFPVNYTVLVYNTGNTDSDWKVTGKIAVHNPAPIDATLNSVDDSLEGIGSVAVDCGVTFPYTLAAGGTLNCTYSKDLRDAATRTNSAFAVLQNTPSGTTAFSGTASVNFASALVNELDTCVTVTDTLSDTLGTVCLPTTAKTFTYSREIDPYAVCGDYTVDNTATFTTVDTGATGSSSASVDVNVPCGGCTLTIGYWKTHAGFGPQADMVTKLLQHLLGTSGGLKTQTVDSAAKAVQFLSFYGSNNFFNASNPVNKLYAQLLGAKLNIADGASYAAVSSTISAADGFLATHDSLSILTKAQKNQVLSWMTTLDNFNNGLIGPGHCSQ